MPLTRSDFMRLLGISVASLLLARCGKLIPETSTPRDRLRRLWFSFGELADRTIKAQASERETCVPVTIPG